MLSPSQHSTGHKIQWIPPSATHLHLSTHCQRPAPGRVLSCLDSCSNSRLVSLRPQPSPNPTGQTLGAFPDEVTLSCYSFSATFFTWFMRFYLSLLFTASLQPSVPTFSSFLFSRFHFICLCLSHRLDSSPTSLPSRSYLVHFLLKQPAMPQADCPRSSRKSCHTPAHHSSVGPYGSVVAPGWPGRRLLAYSPLAPRPPHPALYLLEDSSSFCPPHL